MLRKLGVEAIDVRTPAELATVSGIILPGGESSTMVHLLGLNQLWNPLARFVREKPVLGVCAGAILLARRVLRPEQSSLAAVDITVERNAFGRQLDSFIDAVKPDPAGNIVNPVEAVFIRAPRIVDVGPKARVLLRWKDEPVFVEQGNVLAGTFHPELTQDTTLHQRFLSKVAESTHG